MNKFDEVEIDRLTKLADEASDDLYNEITLIFDKYDKKINFETRWPYEKLSTDPYNQEDYLAGLEDFTRSDWPEFMDFKSANSLLTETMKWFFGFLIFIEAILRLVTVVENKYCGPKAYQYSSITDTVRQIGIDLTPGYFSPIIPKLSRTDWNLIRGQLINDKARIFWAELDDNCECNSCPEDYNLCDKPINFLTDYYNTCLKCQECEYSDEFDPIYA